MGARDDRVMPRSGGPDHAQPGHPPSSAGTGIGASTLAAADEVNRYHAQRLAEHRQTRWPALGELPMHPV